MTHDQFEALKQWRGCFYADVGSVPTLVPTWGWNESRVCSDNFTLQY
jgi:hypothetical protein